MSNMTNIVQAIGSLDFYIYVFVLAILFWSYRGGVYTNILTWPYGHFPHKTEDPTTIALQAFSLVEKAEPIQVRYFTLRLRDQRNMWMQDECKVYMDSYKVSHGSCFMVTWAIFRNYLLEVGTSNTLGDHDILKSHNCWYVIFYHVWGSHMNRKSLK